MEFPLQFFLLFARNFYESGFGESLRRLVPFSLSLSLSLSSPLFIPFRNSIEKRISWSFGLFGSKFFSMRRKYLPILHYSSTHVD